MMIQTEILGAKVEFVEQPFISPLIISSGAITVITEARVEVSVLVDGKKATGRGSIYLSDLWAWPEPSLTHKQRDAVLRKICKNIAGDLWGMCGRKAAHPLELGLALHESVCEETTPPALARAMCASPFDAAIHDAVGIALEQSAFDFYKTPAPLPTADPYFDGDACTAIASIIRAPENKLKAWYIVGKNDTEEDLAPWIRDRGYRCFKIKILGQDNDYDVSRTIEAFQMAKNLGASDIELSVDTNEANPDAASVDDYFRRLKAADVEVFAALKYFEQPTGRDITVHKFDWHEISKLKPVMLDEGLTSLELMGEAAEQGWSGFALKTCKGHSFALLAAAWAKRNNLLISLQDLTNPGLSMIHAALFASRISMINDVELNSPQFTPAANADWLPRLSRLFEPTGGVHRLPAQSPPGLGSTL